MTPKDRILVRDYKNAFSERWPEYYYRLSLKIRNPNHFDITILWNYLKWQRPAAEEAQEVFRLVELIKLENDVNPTNFNRPHEQRSREKTKIKLTEIECNGEL